MLQKCSIFKVASLFFNNPTTEFSLIDVSRKVNLAHTSVKLHLNELKKLNILKTKIYLRGIRKFSVFLADIDNKQFKHYKLLANLDNLANSKLIKYIDDKLMPKSIVLFGSYSRAEDIETSDIDLFVQRTSEELNLKKFEKILGRKIELHFKANFQEYPAELRNSIINGICLKGFMKGYKSEIENTIKSRKDKFFNQYSVDNVRKIK